MIILLGTVNAIFTGLKFSFFSEEDMLAGPERDIVPFEPEDLGRRCKLTDTPDPERVIFCSYIWIHFFYRLF